MATEDTLCRDARRVVWTECVMLGEGCEVSGTGRVDLAERLLANANGVEYVVVVVQVEQPGWRWTALDEGTHAARYRNECDGD